MKMESKIEWWQLHKFIHLPSTRAYLLAVLFYAISVITGGESPWWNTAALVCLVAGFYRSYNERNKIDFKETLEKKTWYRSAKVAGYVFLWIFIALATLTLALISGGLGKQNSGPFLLMMVPVSIIIARGIRKALVYVLAGEKSKEVNIL